MVRLKINEEGLNLIGEILKWRASWVRHRWPGSPTSPGRLRRGVVILSGGRRSSPISRRTD